MTTEEEKQNQKKKTGDRYKTKTHDEASASGGGSLRALDGAGD
jgi:hypothetical protein